MINSGPMIKLWVLALLFSITSYAQTCASRNHIFLIHGIGGTEKTFGVMDRYLEKVNPCNVATHFVYDTGDSKQSTYNFSDSLDEFISKSMVRNNFGPKDRISFIMHSQGGLVGSLWLLNARIKHPEIYARVDSFITLSTPYWGSKMARMGKKFFFNMPEQFDNPLSPMGRIELQEMSYGSPTINAIQSNFDNIFKNSHVRFFAIGGVKTVVNPIVGEGDTTVTVYSSNPNHYSSELSLSGTDKHIKRLNVVPFTTVEATHIPTTLPGIAMIDRDCMKSSYCDHPTIQHILNHLRDPKHRVVKQNKEFQKYRMHFYVKGSEKHLFVRVKKPRGLDEILNFDQKNDGLMSAFFWDFTSDSRPAEVEVEFYLKTKLIKRAVVTVQGGFSTFVKLNPI